MKKLSLLTAILSAGALFGQSSGGEARIQLFADFVRPSDQVIAVIGSTSITDQADNQTGLGIRFMGEIPGTSNWFYQLGGRLESTSSFNKTTSGGTTADARDVDFGYSYWSVGGGYMWNFDNMTLGTHLEGRGESIRLKGYLDSGAASGPVNNRVTYLRPWFRLSFDWSFKAGSARPFVGLDASVAITKASQKSAVGLTVIDERNLKAMAPNFSGGLFVGLRF